MPDAAVTLRSGVDIEATPSANVAGISESQLVRFRQGMVEPLGGWSSFCSLGNNSSSVDDMHVWGDINGTAWLGSGNLTVADLQVRSSSVATQTILPRLLNTNSTGVLLTVSSGLSTVTISDGGLAAGATALFSAIYLNTPMAIGNIILQNGYNVISYSTGAGTYTIDSGIVSSTTLSSNAPTLMGISYGGGNVNILTITIPNQTAVVGDELYFALPTTLTPNTVTISSGKYAINSIIDSTSYTVINPAYGAGAGSTGIYNSSNVSIDYYANQAGLVGPNTITSSGWTLDNWGGALLACAADGPIYIWDPVYNSAKFAAPIGSGPFFNGGIFVSQPQQILVAWKSCQETGAQNNLIVRWSDAADYSNWVVSNATTAGSFQIPTGSVIIGGLQAPNYGVIWTDLDCWVMSYVGGDVVFNFTRAGTGCGLIADKACGVIRNEVYWCGYSNFFHLGSNGVQVVPCTVWDDVFQNINRSRADLTFCAVNSAFDEITWYFPSGTATVCNSYVKYNTATHVWDYGSLSRSAWVDVSQLGAPLAATYSSTANNVFCYQQETGTAMVEVAPNTPLTLPYFKTGWWAIGEGEELAFVDWVIPDFRWGFYSQSQNASIDITFYSVNYPGDTVVTYGPYTVTQATQYITPRIRGRLMSMQAKSNTQSFWRLGRIRYRWAKAGRR